MKFFKYDILFQEVPNEISLAFYIVGCPLRCKGCHSTELWDSSPYGDVLDDEFFTQLLNKYQGYASCILFLGGEWEQERLIELLGKAHVYGYKTALYTGLTEVPQNLATVLDYAKTGPWRSELGGLNSPTTNQEFWDLKKHEKLNHLFQRET